jgi:hypothetical protein
VQIPSMALTTHLMPKRSRESGPSSHLPRQGVDMSREGLADLFGLSRHEFVKDDVEPGLLLSAQAEAPALTPSLSTGR